MLPGKFALEAAGGLSETLGDDEEQAPGERDKALGRITISQNKLGYAAVTSVESPVGPDKSPGKPRSR